MGDTVTRRRLRLWPFLGLLLAGAAGCAAARPHVDRALLAENGIRWIASDEEVLSASTQGLVSRDARGHVRNPEWMYRPYRVAEGELLHLRIDFTREETLEQPVSEGLPEDTFD